MTHIERSTIDIVDQQLTAYNNQDIEAFAATYHDDIEIFSAETGRIMSGKNALISHYGAKFKSLTFLKATSLKRIVHNYFLIDHELAESSKLPSKEIDTQVKVIAAYEVVDGLIKKVTFMK